MDNNYRSESVAAAVREARALAGLTQANLATEMRNRGFNWSQATLWSIEKGHRELRWSEGMALRELIGFSPEEPSGDPQIARDAATYRRLLRVIGENEAVAS